MTPRMTVKKTLLASTPRRYASASTPRSFFSPFGDYLGVEDTLRDRAKRGVVAKLQIKCHEIILEVRRSELIDYSFKALKTLLVEYYFTNQLIYYSTN